MSEHEINGDLSKLAVVHTADMEWQASPSPSVWRKRLDLSGPLEAGRVTSVVRYDADSRFAQHPHPDGEEILVLEGVFSDERGDYPAGTYLLNPEGFSHAPFSREGCVLFVKLRQYPGSDRRQVTIDSKATDLRDGEVAGLEVLDLYGEPKHPERIRLLRLEPGAILDSQVYLGGQEIFVLEGELENGERSYRAGSWARYPAGSRHALTSEGGCLFYEKTGHLVV
ncbi:MAG: cupin domain-containing protein [Kiloniellales bacterium]|nr:cupin domain-containing protein [Kiloniellales bacterium]